MNLVAKLKYINIQNLSAVEAVPQIPVGCSCRYTVQLYASLNLETMSFNNVSIWVQSQFQIASYALYILPGQGFAQTIIHSHCKGTVTELYRNFKGGLTFKFCSVECRRWVSLADWIWL